MNEFLAELYGTRETIGATEGSDDVEKLAEAQILDQVFEAEGIDVNAIPDEAIVKVAYELFGDDSALVKMATDDGDADDEEGAEEEEGEEEEGEDKVAQADFLGRVMAHSFVNEQDSIKLAGGKKEVAKKGLDAVLAALKGKGQAAGKAIKGAPGQAGAALKGKGKAMQKSFQAGKKGKGGGTISGLKRMAKEHKKTMIGVGAGLGTAGAAGTYAAMKKKSSVAVEHLAEQRAMELLKEAGYDLDDGEDKLASAVESRAYEMLAEAGYLE